MSMLGSSGTARRGRSRERASNSDDLTMVTWNLSPCTGPLFYVEVVRRRWYSTEVRDEGRSSIEENPRTTSLRLVLRGQPNRVGGQVLHVRSSHSMRLRRLRLNGVQSCAGEE